MRITPAALDHIKEPGDPMWNQYVPTMQELDVVDGVDRLARRGRRLAGAEHHASVSRPRALSRQPGLRQLLPLLHPATQGRRSREDPAQPVRIGASATSRRTRRSATSSCRAAIPMMLSDRRLEYIFQTAARDPARRDHPDRQPHHVAPAGADHARVLRDGEEVPSHLHEHALQPPERADACRGRGARTAGGCRRPARLPDGAAPRRERRSRS